MYRVLLVVTLLLSGIAGSFSVASAAPVESEFMRTWQRTDQPVANGQVSRTWMWGPEAFTTAGHETYIGVPGGERLVQYFDKSRMEINDLSGDPTSPWYVTNGLLVVEMTSGEIHTGFDERMDHGWAEINVAGDSDDPTGPTYATIGDLIDDPPVTYTQGDVIFDVIDYLGWDPLGTARMADELAAYGVTAAEFSPATGKYTASVFWEFMNSSALIYQDGSYVNAPLFQDPYYATGLPIDEAWWAEVAVGGTDKWVLLQCFERRCLTYTPDNPPGWQVEAGNVGQHYYEWRYGNGGEPVDPPPPPPPPPPTDPPPPPPVGDDNSPAEGEVLYNTPMSQWRSASDDWGNRAYRSGSEYHLNLQPYPFGYFYSYASAGSASFGNASYSVNIRRPSAFGVSAGCMAIRASHRSEVDLCLTFDSQSTIGFTALFYENVGSSSFREEILLTGLIDAGSPQEWHNLKLISRGQRIWVYVNEQFMGSLNYDGGTIHDGVIGIVGYNYEPNLNVTLAFQNFVVRAIE